MNRQLGQIETELRNLFEMRIAGKIVPIDGKTGDQIYEEYRIKKEAERKKILEARQKLEENSLEWKQKASNFYSDCTNATKKFLKAKEEKQHQFLRAISSNYFLNDKKVIVTHKTPFSELVKFNQRPSVLPSPRLNITQAQIEP